MGHVGDHIDHLWPAFWGRWWSFFAEVIRGFHPANREEKSTELGECSEAPDGRYLFPCCEVVVITALVGDIASSCSAGYSKSTRFHMISIDFLIFTDFLQCPR